MEISFVGEDGGTVFLVDRIDWENKKIYFADVHMFSEVEFFVNANIFREMNEKVSSIYYEYSKLKNAFSCEVIRAVSKLINLYMKDLKPTVSDLEFKKLDKIDEEDILEEEDAKLRELFELIKGGPDGIHEGTGKVSG
jgi:anion-transporting  ArsA/GET3 family ATPase